MILNISRLNSSTLILYHIKPKPEMVTHTNSHNEPSPCHSQPQTHYITQTSSDGTKTEYTTKSGNALQPEHEGLCIERGNDVPTIIHLQERKFVARLRSKVYVRLKECCSVSMAHQLKKGAKLFNLRLRRRDSPTQVHLKLQLSESHGIARQVCNVAKCGIL